MTIRLDSKKEVWLRCQKLLPEETRQKFATGVSFCMQERELRNRLIADGMGEIWLQWRTLARPLIRALGGRRYASEAYRIQQADEQQQRGDAWSACIQQLLDKNHVPTNGILLDVGANSGVEVSDLSQRIICLDISEEALKHGKSENSDFWFASGSADCLPFPDGAFDAYLSLRTWCVAGVLADEALKEALRVVKKGGAIIVSFPLRFPLNLSCEYRTLSNAIDDHIKPIAEWTKDLFAQYLDGVESKAEPEDYFIFGR